MDLNLSSGMNAQSESASASDDHPCYEDGSSGQATLTKPYHQHVLSNQFEPFKQNISTERTRHLGVAKDLEMCSSGIVWQLMFSGADFLWNSMADKPGAGRCTTKGLRYNTQV